MEDKSNTIHTNGDEIEQFVGFMLGEREFAIPFFCIKEIAKPAKYTRVPCVPNYILGVLNLCGDIVPIVDLNAKFNLPTTQNATKPCYIVIKEGDNIIGFLVDMVTKILRINRRNIDRTPAEPVIDETMIEGVCKKDDNTTITLLNIKSLFKRDF